MRVNVNTALSFAGLWVDEAGSLIQGETATTLPEAESGRGSWAAIGEYSAFTVLLPLLPSGAIG